MHMLNNKFSSTKLILAVTLLLALVLVSGPSSAQLNSTLATQAILIDFETGSILYEKESKQQMPTSSMSKVMTMYLVFEALRDGRLLMDTKLPVSEKAWRKGGSKMFVEVDKRVSVEDLIRGVIIQSGNDATIVLAEGLGGTEDDFAKALTEKAKQLGMNDSNFKNASGWPDPDHYSTAYDLSILARRIISDFPEHYNLYSEKEFTFNNIKQPNRNPLLYRNIGADGIKTGHTDSGGYGLIGSGTRDGRRVILVLNGLKSEKDRAQESARLLEWGLRGFENVELFAENAVVADAQVALGKSDTVPMQVSGNVKITIPTFIKNDLKVEVKYDGPIKAPIKAGAEIGKLVVSVPRGQTYEYPLSAAQPVQKVGIFSIFVANTKAKLGM